MQLLLPAQPVGLQAQHNQLIWRTSVTHAPSHVQWPAVAWSGELAKCGVLPKKPRPLSTGPPMNCPWCAICICVQYALDYYPPFASGCGFILSRDLVQALVKEPLPDYRLLVRMCWTAIFSGPQPTRIAGRHLLGSYAGSSCCLPVRCWQAGSVHACMYMRGARCAHVQDPPFGIHLCGKDLCVLPEGPVTPVHDPCVRPYRGIPIFKPTTIVQHYLTAEEMGPFHAQVCCHVCSIPGLVTASLGQAQPSGGSSSSGTLMC